MRKYMTQRALTNTQISAIELLGLMGIHAGSMKYKLAHLADAGRVRKLPKTGKTYPHSSTRQRARYARQIDNGQLSYA